MVSQLTAGVSPPRIPSGHGALVAILGHTAAGKSALGIALAKRLQGEIISCDSTTVYRGFDIGTDKVPEAAHEGVPHHMIDIVEPTDAYSAARYAETAAGVIRAITGRGRVPILVGGTGLYYRALTRGIFPGPGRDSGLRARLERVARRFGPERLHRYLATIDGVSASRIQPRDTKRMVRAIEVYRLTGRTLTDHFKQTRSPLDGFRPIGFAIDLSAEERSRRIVARVEHQFADGLLDEVRGLLASGVPATAHPFSGLVYRQVLEHMRGVRDERATRELIVQENRRYARRQLIWFRKEPNLYWILTPGERLETLAEVERELCARFLKSRRQLADVHDQ